jgi:hypothetical protein
MNLREFYVMFAEWDPFLIQKFVYGGTVHPRPRLVAGHKVFLFTFVLGIILRLLSGEAIRATYGLLGTIGLIFLPVTE